MDRIADPHRDSVIIAVGMVSNIWIMVAANIVALAVMLAASGPLSRFVERHPSVTILALAFLLLIGGNLLLEGFGYHVPKGYTYAAMGFAVAVEMLQLRYRKRTSRRRTAGPKSAVPESGE